jgi:hypothetical protein
MATANTFSNDFLVDLALRARQPHAALVEGLDDAEARDFGIRLCEDRRTLAAQVQALSLALVHIAGELDAGEVAMLHWLLKSLGERIELAADLAVVIDNRFDRAA